MSHSGSGNKSNKKYHFKYKLNKEGILVDEKSDFNTVNQFTFQIPPNAKNSPKKLIDLTQEEESQRTTNNAPENDESQEGDQLFKMDIKYIM
jgi:hypothetical protein